MKTRVEGSALLPTGAGDRVGQVQARAGKVHPRQPAGKPESATHLGDADESEECRRGPGRGGAGALSWDPRV